MPYITLVATKDIPPKDEITIDYNPAANREKANGPEGKKRGRSKKAKEDLDEEETICVCGSSICRGII